MNIPRAFPVPENGYDGMTLRDWFAGQIASGMVADPNIYPSIAPKDFAEACFKIADAMLVERERKGVA